LTLGKRLKQRRNPLLRRRETHHNGAVPGGIETRVGVQAGGQRGMHQVFGCATQRHKEMMIVGVDDWAAACEVGRNGDRLLGELDAPALPVVARKGQRGLAYQVMPGWVRCAGELRPRRSQRTGGVLFGIALRTRCQCWRRCDASSRQKQFPSGQYIGAWLWHVDVETRCVRR